MLKQAGEKETFETGAQRDSQAGKCRPDLISPYALERVGWINKYGADHYGDRNWEKGMKFSRMMASLERHRVAYLQGKTDEDHLAQLAWNALALLHFEDQIKLGLLSGSLNDLPLYERQKGAPARLCVSEEERKLNDWSPQDMHLTASQAETMRHPGNGEFIPVNFTSGRHGTIRAAKPKTLYPEGDPYYHPDGQVKRSRFYIAGPMRGIENFNFPAFDTASQVGRDAGYEVISPADMDRNSGFKENDSPEKAASLTKVFVKRDVDALLSLNPENGDGIALLPGWDRSTGAMAEVMLARWLKLKVVDARTFEPFPKDTFFHGLTLLKGILSFIRGEH